MVTPQASPWPSGRASRSTAVRDESDVVNCQGLAESWWREGVELCRSLLMSASPPSGFVSGPELAREMLGDLAELRIARGFRQSTETETGRRASMVARARCRRCGSFRRRCRDRSRGADSPQAHSPQAGALPDPPAPVKEPARRLTTSHSATPSQEAAAYDDPPESGEIAVSALCTRVCSRGRIVLRGPEARPS